MKGLQAEQKLSFYLLNKCINDTYFLLYLLNIFNFSVFYTLGKKKGPDSINESFMIFSSLKFGENIVWKSCFILYRDLRMVLSHSNVI